MKQEQVKTHSLVKQAAKVFQNCPCCKSPNLIKFEGEAICFYCDWNSAEITGELSRGWSTRLDAGPSLTHASLIKSGKSQTGKTNFEAGRVVSHGK